MAKITRISLLTGKKNTMEIPNVTEADIQAWRDSRRLIQDCFPHLTKAQREFLISGSTQEEWDEAFGDEEEDDDDTKLSRAITVIIPANENEFTQPITFQQLRVLILSFLNGLCIGIGGTYWLIWHR